MNSTYSFRIFGLSKYFQKIIIGEKVEAWEDLPLCLQIHIKRFLDLFQFQIHVIQCVKQAWKWKIAKLSPLQELLKVLPLKVSLSLKHKIMIRSVSSVDWKEQQNSIILALTRDEEQYNGSRFQQLTLKIQIRECLWSVLLTEDMNQTWNKIWNS